MSDYIRVLAALLFAVLLWAQARKTGQRWRRRAFALAAGAMLALAGYNAVVLVSMPAGPLGSGLLALCGFLILGTLGALILAARAGELRQPRQQYDATLQDEISRRQQEHERRPK